MPATVKKVRDVPPEQIENVSIDASFLIRFFTKVDPTIYSSPSFNPQHYADCIKFLIEKNIYCFVSDLVVEEIYFLILKAYGQVAFDFYAPKPKYKDWKKFCEDNPTYIQPAYPTINKFNEFLDENAIFPMDYTGNPAEAAWLYNKANVIIQNFNLLSNDAFIIAHGLHCGLKNFLTTDKKWNEVDGITIYNW